MEKLRDVYSIGDDTLVMIATDRISFDVVHPKESLTGTSIEPDCLEVHDATADIVPNWKSAEPDPMVTVGHRCEPIKWRWLSVAISPEVPGEYKKGVRVLCGLPLPEDARTKNSETLITPTTKADKGHDISREIIAQGLVSGRV